MMKISLVINFIADFAQDAHFDLSRRFTWKARRQRMTTTKAQTPWTEIGPSPCLGVKSLSSLSHNKGRWLDRPWILTWLRLV